MLKAILAFTYMVVEMGRLKKILLSCLIGASYLMTMPAVAQLGPACTWPFKPLRWVGPAFANAFCTLTSQGFFNNYGNAGFW
jgi:hypothetical protein